MATALQIYNESLNLMGEHSLANLSVDEEPRYVLDDVYTRAITYCLQLGWWRFALQTATVTLTVSASVPGFAYTFPKPSNWVRTHSVGVIGGTHFYPVDWTDVGGNVAVKHSATTAIRFIKAGSAEVDPANWPEVFARVVSAYVAFEACERITQSSAKKADIGKILADRIAVARETESHTPPLMLPEHGIERATRQMLELGAWKFAMATLSITPSLDTPSPPYTYCFDKPAVWMRTIRVARIIGNTECDIDYRDESFNIHANYTPISLRYISSAAIIPSANWPEGFRRAHEALLAYVSAQHTGASEQQIAAAMAHWKTLLGEALIKDALNERPKVYRTSSFNKARGGAYRYSREQGY